MSDRLVGFAGDSWQERALPLPGAYELHLPSGGVTIWYVVAPYSGQEIISIQLVRLDA